jgi:hypothetical protein
LGPSQLDEAFDRKCRETDFDRQNVQPVGRRVCQKIGIFLADSKVFVQLTELQCTFHTARKT